jgi:hypothetical protein
VEDAKKADEFAFSSIMFDILVDRSTFSGSLSFDEKENRKMNNWNFPMIPNSVPVFFRELIERG